MEKCYLFGGGSNAYGVIEYIGKSNIIGVVDNEPKLQNEYIENVPIYSFEKFLLTYKGELVVITAAMYGGIVEQLEANGINHYTIAPLIIMGMAEEKQIADEFELNDCEKIFFLGYNVLTERISEYLLEKDPDKKLCILDDKDKFLQYMPERYKLVPYDKVTKNDIVVVCKEKLDEKDLLFVQSNNVYDVYDLIPQKNKIYIERLKKLKDSHKNEKCFIIGNGPSLEIKDLERMQDLKIDNFGMNLIYNIYPMTKWRPTYYVITEYNLFRTYYKELSLLEHKNMFIKNFFCLKQNDYFNDALYYTGYARRAYHEEQRFSEDISKIVYSGYSVMYDAIQLAVYMGYSEIYLIGADFSYLGSPEEKGNHVYDNYTTEKRKFSGKSYIDASMKALRLSREYADAHGIKIYNATRGGKLEIFERMDVDIIFEQCKEKIL